VGELSGELGEGSVSSLVVFLMCESIAVETKARSSHMEELGGTTSEKYGSAVAKARSTSSSR
jgi:hypothetical protein